MNINKVIADEIGVKEEQVEAAVSLLDEGATVPFISRYRKEVTGGLNDENLRFLKERLDYLRELLSRKETIISSIEEQGKMTKELKKKIDDAITMVALEDLYRPYKPKKKTKASIAKEKGLEPLAIVIWEQKAKQKIETYAKKFLNDDVKTIDEAVSGALDIIAEMISDVADFRTYIRDYVLDNGIIKSEMKQKNIDKTYEQYEDYEERINKIPPHRILALNRGENEKVLKVDININNDEIISYLKNEIIKQDNKYTNSYLLNAIEDSFNRLIWSSIENEVRGILTSRAEESSILTFSKNLQQILMQSPIQNKVVLGWDPAFRTGCKLAVCDTTGKVLTTTIIYPTAPTTEEKCEEARKILKKLISEYNIELISLGNGTASRESEMFIVDFLKKEKIKNVHYVIVSEAGASVYSASKVATEEFPNFDVGQRSATSIARRLQDPLAELVKIDPKSIGVGQYQHDMNQKKLTESLENTVETCVNNVGVDLNTASYSLLSYVSGINKSLAKSIVDYREKNGRFNNRNELKNIDKLGAKAFEQSAGFLRIIGGDEPLDRTGVHPESYSATNKLLKSLNYTKKDLSNGCFEGISKLIVDYDKTANSLKIGVETLKDIVSELEKPGRDPRNDMPKPILKSDILNIEDLKEGMILKGTVRNCIDFGVFVDIGVHHDGLVHISQITNKYIKHPLDVVSIGDVVDVKVLGVDLEKNRISLTMRLDETNIINYRDRYKTNSLNNNDENKIKINEHKQKTVSIEKNNNKDVDNNISDVIDLTNINKLKISKRNVNLSTEAHNICDSVEETNKKTRKKTVLKQDDEKKIKKTKTTKTTKTKKMPSAKTSAKKDIKKDVSSKKSKKVSTISTKNK